MDATFRLDDGICLCGAVFSYRSVGDEQLNVSPTQKLPLQPRQGCRVACPSPDDEDDEDDDVLVVKSGESR